MSRMRILYITHNRLEFTRKTLPQLLDHAGSDDYSVFVVDNSSSDGTTAWLSALEHPRLAGVRLNQENVSLRKVTNEFWEENADAEFLGKVDNDTLVPPGFLDAASAALRNPVRLGAIGAAHFEPDFAAAVNHDLYARYIKPLPDGTKLLLQRHLGGCCYLIRAKTVARFGYLPDIGYFKGGWTEYQWRLLEAGYPSAYLYPFVFATHFPDDPVRVLRPMYRKWARQFAADLLTASKGPESHREALIRAAHQC